MFTYFEGSLYSKLKGSLYWNFALPALPNTSTVYVTLSGLKVTCNINPNKHIIMAGDLYIFFNTKLDVVVGNPTLKRKSLAKLIEHKDAYDLCDI